jgi:Cytochrome c7 and related cytochrome c
VNGERQPWPLSLLPVPWLDWIRRAGAPAGWGVLLGAAALVAVWALRPYPVGPEQPLPFSHRRHAGVRGISCYFCHPGADRSPVAGVPEIGRCLLCHNRVIPYFTPIRKLHESYQTGKPIEWVRVYRLADFVHFNHAAHLRKNVDCGRCHGDVKNMDRIILNQRLIMGFCVDCHRRPEFKASVDCWFCHR